MSEYQCYELLAAGLPSETHQRIEVRSPSTAKQFTTRTTTNTDH